MIEFLTTVKTKSDVLVDAKTGEQAILHNGIFNATYTDSGLIVKGAYYYLVLAKDENGDVIQDEDGNDTYTQVILNWNSSKSLLWSEVNALYATLDINYPTDPTQEDIVKANLTAGLLYLTQQDAQYGTTANDWEV